MNYYRRVLASTTNYHLSDHEIIAQLHDFRKRAIESENKPKGKTNDT
jgi:hypothetical protein